MSHMPRSAPVTAVQWPDLVAELDAWGEAARIASLWWRDDDAVAATPALDRLLSIAEDTPIALAVVPAAADATLARRVTCAAGVEVLQHGWSHANHGGLGKKSEFPAMRAEAAVLAELAAGRARLTRLFAGRVVPVLAPPWNRFADRFVPLLRECGLFGLSRAAAAGARLPDGGVEVGAPVDLVAWKAGRGFVGTGPALAALIGHLRGRRLGGVCPDVPLGILTHHLVQDAATESFLRRLVGITRAHGAVRWLAAREVFAR